MEKQIRSDLYSRQAISKNKTTNFLTRLPSSQSKLAHDIIKNPYNFDCLGLHDEALEREIEHASLQHISKFLIELGKGFAFLGNQVPIEINERTYFLDMLFYHIKLHAYLIVELKASAFKPEYAGKLNFYLSTVNDILRSPKDNPSIGLLLCKTSDKVLKEAPLAFFDSIEYIKKQMPPNYLSQTQKNDFIASQGFLKSYRGSLGTFNSYRRDIERLLHWCMLIVNKSLKQIKRDDVEAFIRFCQNPKKTWIGIKKSPRFIEKEGLRIANIEWRPYIATVSKAEFRKGEEPKISQFKLSLGAIKQLLAIISTFYNYLLQEEYVVANPVMLIRQKSKFIRKQQGPVKIRRLSELQWRYVLKTATELAENDPKLHERTLFIISILYSMYLRISELIANPRWTPVMNHFQRDSNGKWWFTTVGKGHKQRQIAVSDALLIALKRWRKHLGLSPLPSPTDNSPLVPKTKGLGPMANTTQIRKIVQYCFDKAIEKLRSDGYKEESETLVEAAVHWLRHTGISDDVKRRPREHVRDDAGHSSSATTDKYIDIELKERHKSAKSKPMA